MGVFVEALYVPMYVTWPRMESGNCVSGILPPESSVATPEFAPFSVFGIFAARSVTRFVTCDSAIRMLMADADVARPFASIVMTTALDALPYPPAETPLVVRLGFG